MIVSDIDVPVLENIDKDQIDMSSEKTICGRYIITRLDQRAFAALGQEAQPAGEGPEWFMVPEENRNGTIPSTNSFRVLEAEG